MFTYQLTRSGSTVLSGSTTRLTTDSIDLHQKKYDTRRLWLIINITSGGSMAFDCCIAGTPSSTTTTYLPISYGGSTIQFRNGTSVNGFFGDGKHLINLVQGRYGVTMPLTGVPYIRIGYVAFHKPANWTGQLVIG